MAVQKPLISVIIPVYNSAPYLRRCLDSVVNQTYKNLEIIVVNDGSKDRSADIAAEYAASDSRILIINQENKGQASARNKALSIAKGEWISFVDSDDKCETDMIAKLISAALRKHADISRCGLWIYKGSHKNAVRMHVQAGVYRGDNLLKWYFADNEIFATVCTALFRRKFFEQVEFPDGRIYEDAYIWPRILTIAESCVCVDVPLYHYYQRENGTCSGSSIKRQMDMLWVYDENIKFVNRKIPLYTGYIHRCRFEMCCILLEKIDAAGRKKNKKYWRQAVQAFRESERNMEGWRFFHYAAAFFFGISPVLFVKIYRAYNFLKFKAARFTIKS